MTWKPQPQRLIERLTTADITLLSLRGRSGKWKLHLLAGEREKIVHANDIMNDLDCKAKCQSVLTFDGVRANHPELTNEQREALIKAFELGYFNIPQDIQLDGVADELEISHQALSERLHRAYHQLVKSEFVVTEEDHR